MYSEANDRIAEGLGLGPRTVLAGASFLLGMMMMLVAGPEEGDKQVFLYGFGGFCFLICAACFARGRARQFLGSAVGLLIFAVGIWYLASMLFAGPSGSSSRAQPSVLNAVLYLAFIGGPGAAYAWKARFGFRRTR